jgi:hypothetical protein
MLMKIELGCILLFFLSVVVLPKQLKNPPIERRVIPYCEYKINDFIILHLLAYEQQVCQ